MLFELEDVRLTRGDRVVLDGFSAEITEGATAIVGPSGSGKSSLLRLLNRLADPDRGVIRYRGDPLADRDVLALRREVGLVPQLPALIEGTVADNIAFAAGLGGAADASGPGVEESLRLAGLDAGFADRDVTKLSVGEQQRAMLARALAIGPSVLLLDEPTSALDAAATEAVEQALSGLRRRGDLSLVIVTHDPAQAERLADASIRLETAGGVTQEAAA